MTRYLFMFILLIACSVTALQGSEYSAIESETIEDSSSQFRVISYFNVAIVTTYFKKSMYLNYVSIAPIRQEFNYLATGEVFKTRDYEEMNWNDSLGYWFIYWDAIKDHTLYTRIYLTPDSVEASFELKSSHIDW